jgi:hypothetical protein
MSGSKEYHTLPPAFNKSHSLFSRNSSDLPIKLNLINKNEDESPNNMEAMEKDTGLFWMFEDTSPMDNKQETFTSQAQCSTSQTDDMNDVENSMSNLNVNQSNSSQNYSVNNL